MQDSVVFVDVRTQEEFFNGSCLNFINIPLGDFISKFEELRHYKEIVLVCQSGERAEIAKKFLEAKGFTSVKNAGSWFSFES